jgi:hypothetical protein
MTGATRYTATLPPEAAILLDALQKIRKTGYGCKITEAPQAMLACIEIAEDAVNRFEITTTERRGK